ncbi:hypothetical protein B2J93_1669 [Marssonina coronariae]|uniref:histidine kinase n=1 Tax=Diplocarpon coronariae TaxID=2795749 RepID=A0A218ZDD7_9HELO|nr:hypothetical protein B2J93_1669 [Marssonina coronariae]
MPPPKPPKDKPASPTQKRRPSKSRPASSDNLTASPKHGMTTASPSRQMSKDSMSDLPSGAKALPRADSSDTKNAQSSRGSRSDGPRATSFEGQRLSTGGEYTDGQTERTGSSETGAGHGKSAIPKNTSPAEVERLRAAMNAQLQLNQHRERLAKQMEGVEAKESTGSSALTSKARVSPIHEETLSPSLDVAFATPITAGLETASTESAKTIRGGSTPGPMAVRTPSYPFPPMRTPGQFSSNGHRPFTALSPTVNPSNYAGGSFDSGLQDRVLSGSVTPASTSKFQPQGASESQGDLNFETPNLYDLCLLLTSEPGLDPWWTTLVQILREFYQAHRVTLSVPADPTDVENVPWGQKATFNVMEEDELSLTYLPRGSSLVPSSVDTNDTSNSEDTNPAEDTSTAASPLYSSSTLRPGLLSRHSFTAYEDTKRDPLSTWEGARTAAARLTPLARAKSYFSTHPELPPRTATLQNAELSLQSLRDHIAFEDAHKPPEEWEDRVSANREVRGRMFSVLQALDFEAEPLIDNKGVSRVVERGKVIALTRDYPYVESTQDEKSGGSKSSHTSTKSRNPPDNKSKPAPAPDTGSRIASFFGSRSRKSSRASRDKGKGFPSSLKPSEEQDRSIPRYEEYEQAPPSPWSQSPAPSPAVRLETSENPFFATAPIDEETFNPQTAPADYADLPPPQTIGTDQSWTVLHIPLIHPLLSKPIQSFRLDAAAMESRSAGRGKGIRPNSTDSEDKTKANDATKEKQTPIAILSILSPVIPYPSPLRHSLEHLAPHLATSFSLCRHFSNLETEITGLSRKRPQTTGFGAVAGGRVPEDRLRAVHPACSPNDEGTVQQSAGGSITSPSDYSGVSRSTAGSPAGTPGWDPGSVGFSMEKRSSGESPGYVSAEGYFGTRTRPGIGRVDTGSASSITGARRSSKESSPVETRSQRVPRDSDERPHPEGVMLDQGDDSMKARVRHDEGSSTSMPRQEFRAGLSDMSENREISPSRLGQDASLPPRRLAMRAASNQGLSRPERQHSQLHSYGADFGATFQSLPVTTPSAKGPIVTKPTASRAGTATAPPDYMPPPSDRVKGIMLDSLPMHIFIALPPTGEMVWVNSRYLAYRGQSVKDLHEDPWASLHPDEREEYLRAWAHAIRTGEQFSMQVRLRRFDGSYRWFYTRAVSLRDSRGVIVQWYGTHMDIHEQHIAEVKAARQEEIEASEAKHRQLANLIPQIIFSATEEEGVTFANQQWLSYTGQAYDDALGLGFMDFVHPEDVAKCHFSTNFPPTPLGSTSRKPAEPSRNPSQASSGGKSRGSAVSDAPTERTIKGVHPVLSGSNSSSSDSVYEFPSGDLSRLMKAGVIKGEIDGNGRTSYSTEIRLQSKSGEYRWHLVRCVEVDNIINLGSGDGSWFGACADINDHKLLEMKLKEAMDSKSKFLSNMSHEIRTPLIGISGMITFLQDSRLDDDQIDFCNTIASSADGLLNIINDILDLAKADAGMMKLSYNWFHTRSLVEEVNEMVSTIAMTKHLEVNYVVDGDVPDMVKGDRFRIRQVLLNVIGNAIKFTDSGEVFSRCKVLKETPDDVGENEVVLEFSIIDTGRGFTQDEAEKIFKPFSQIDASSTRTQGGTGLGLVISRQLVELHGGKMEGTAVPGKGATFTFTVKFQLPTTEDHPDAPPTPASSAGPSARTSLRSSISYESAARAIKHAGGNPSLASKLFGSAPADRYVRVGPDSPCSPPHTWTVAREMRADSLHSPRTESSSTGSQIIGSSASSDPSIHSLPSQTTQRTSSSSVPQALAYFGEAARAIATDPSNMKLELPERVSPAGSESTSQGVTPTPVVPSGTPGDTLPSKPSMNFQQLRPPMYSILLICPQEHSREATTQHIEMTLPKDIPHQITSLASVEAARAMIGGEDPVIFTHIVLNLSHSEDIVALIDQIMASTCMPQTSIVVLSDPVQRQEVMKVAAGYDYEQLAKDNRVTFIYKPVKPSRFAVVFDPDKERDLSTDRNRYKSQQQVASTRQNYADVRERVGDKGLLVLLVEDNATNQKVLTKYLDKIGIKCDLHMPNKDGYQACREIREWEQQESFPRMPIIALSANVMADVLDKCVEAGFSNYITKPVDFKVLSTVIGDLLDPIDPTAASRIVGSL